MSRPRILVVDDEPAMLQAVERVLSEFYEVRLFTDGNEALHALPLLEPDLAILDVRMPAMDGFELLGRLQAERPDLDVILMTGSLNEPDAKLVRAIRAGAFYFLEKPLNREVLLTLVERCLELRRLARQNALLMGRQQRELDAAREFQLSLLPREVPGEAAGHVAWGYVPSHELSGDYVDCAWIRNIGISILVADVAGHGAPAAMLTSVVKAAFDATRDSDYDPRAVAATVGNTLRSFAPGKFVTLFAARYHVDSGRFEYVNAGHPPALWVGRTGEVRLLQSTGPIVTSALPDSSWDGGFVMLEPDDAVVVYTDGIVEARKDDNEFGIEGLLEVLTGASREPAPLVARIVERVLAFADGGPRDDLTVLCLRGPARRPAAARASG
ncbi:MAG: PP2C family protein-serine/threonine phosphatase [Candidatus Eiseniibacteriota bacterium]